MPTFAQIVPENELWSVLDSSKLQDYETCPRKFFFRHILGWSPAEEANIHLEFGTAAHLAMEVLSTEGYTPATRERAFALFLEHYRRYFPIEQDEGNKPKTPENFLRALLQYCGKYAQDNFDVLHVEVAGTVPVSSTHHLHFKMDTICHGEQGYFSLEHKTSSRYSTLWEADWRQKIQIGTYNHVLYCCYPQLEVYGVIINGIFLHDAPTLKRDGEPYAGARDNEFHRVPVRLSPEQMEGWRQDVVAIIENIEEELVCLGNTTFDDTHMSAFRRNRQSCTSYGICRYLNICSTTQNPVRAAEQTPASMKIEYWDPRNIPTIKERMTL